MKLSKEFIAMFREEAKKAQWEINSWNGKSIDDLVVDYLERKELKPEDFRDVVVLTVEEAEYALKVVRFAITTCEAVNEHKDKLWNFASLLHRRIEQVEKGNEVP